MLWRDGRTLHTSACPVSSFWQSLLQYTTRWHSEQPALVLESGRIRLWQCAHTRKTLDLQITSGNPFSISSVKPGSMFLFAIARRPTGSPSFFEMKKAKPPWLLLTAAQRPSLLLASCFLSSPSEFVGSGGKKGLNSPALGGFTKMLSYTQLLAVTRRSDKSKGSSTLFAFVCFPSLLALPAFLLPPLFFFPIGGTKVLVELK
mmetsp:Transcript_30908/g.60332  ORF Transcript_30908/g.60332 Transcript_30908/m.60332 type:complete len:203 (+) Transcript_30908:968-1576(+)